MKFFIRSFLLIQFLFSFSIVKGQSSLIDSLLHTDSIRHLVRVLASDSLQGRYPGTTESLNAADFIADEFEKAGLSSVAGNNGFFQEVKVGWFNVIGAIKGKSKPGQLIIFSAHYDHIGSISTNPYPGFGGQAKAEKGDTIYNGANDNASGVSAVISLAKYFKALNNNERTLIFVAFTGEELGLLGSKYFVAGCEPDSIIAVINFDMIGRGQFSNSHPFVTGYEKSDLIDILNRNYRSLPAKNSEREFFKRDKNTNEFLFNRSDNFSFAVKGVPAHSIMVTPSNDEYYHNLNDETRTLDFNLMKKVIRAIAIGTTGLITGKDTPSRIKEAD